MVDFSDCVDSNDWLDNPRLTTIRWGTRMVPSRLVALGHRWWTISTETKSGMDVLISPQKSIQRISASILGESDTSTEWQHEWTIKTGRSNGAPKLLASQ